MPGPKVRCCVCDHEWAATNPGVLYRSADKRWWCKSEQECQARRERLMASMQRALDLAWAVLDLAVT